MSATEKNPPSKTTTVVTNRLGSWTYWAAVPAYLAVLSVIYASALVVSYGFSDTYNVLAHAMQHQLYLNLHAMLLGGRPLYALATALTFDRIHGLAQLHWLRFAGLVAMAGFAAIYAAVLHRQRVPAIWAWTVPLVTVCMPPFQVYAAWAVCSFYPWAAVLAGLAFLCADRLPAQPWRLVSASVLLTAALALYQPAAMTFWLLAGAAWLGAEHRTKWARLLICGAVMASALVLDFILSRTVPLVVERGGYDLGRTQLLGHPWHKLLWFIRYPLEASANLTGIVPHAPFAIGILAFVVVGLTLRWRRFGHIETASRLFLALVLLPLAYLPNLVVAEDWASYRTEPALTGLVTLYVALALLGWLPGVSRKRVRLAFIASAALAFTAFSASYNVTEEFALPQRTEWMLLRHALARPSVAEANPLYLRLAPSRDHLAPVARFDEFGIPSFSKFWAPGPMVWLMGHFYGLRAAQHLAGKPILMQQAPNPVMVGKTACVLDLGKVLKGTTTYCR